MSQRTLAFGIGLVASGMVSVTTFLIGASRLPLTAGVFLLVLVGLPLIFMLWADADQREAGGPAVPGIAGGIWFLVFGPTLLPWYLWRTRDRQSPGRSALVLCALGLPYMTALAGALLARA